MMQHVDETERWESAFPWKAVAAMAGIWASFLILGPLLGWAELRWTGRAAHISAWVGALLGWLAFLAGVYLFLVWPLSQNILPRYRRQWGPAVSILVAAAFVALPLVSFSYFMAGNGLYDLHELLWVVAPAAVVGMAFQYRTEQAFQGALVVAGLVGASLFWIHDGVGPYGGLIHYLSRSDRFYKLREVCAAGAVVAALVWAARSPWTVREKVQGARWALGTAFVASLVLFYLWPWFHNRGEVGRWPLGGDLLLPLFPFALAFFRFRTPVTYRGLRLLCGLAVVLSLGGAIRCWNHEGAESWVLLRLAYYTLTLALFGWLTVFFRGDWGRIVFLSGFASPAGRRPQKPTEGSDSSKRAGS